MVGSQSAHGWIPVGNQTGQMQVEARRVGRTCAVHVLAPRLTVRTAMFSRRSVLASNLLTALSLLFSAGCSAEPAVEEADAETDALKKGAACSVRIDERPWSDSAPTCTTIRPYERHGDDYRVRFVGCTSDEICAMTAPFDSEGSRSIIESQAGAFYEKSGRCLPKQTVVDRALSAVSRFTGKQIDDAHGEIRLASYYMLPGDFSPCPGNASHHFDLPAVAEPPQVIDGVEYNVHAAVPYDYRVRVDLAPESGDPTPLGLWVRLGRDLDGARIVARTSFDPNLSEDERRENIVSLGTVGFFPFHGTSAASIEQLRLELTSALGGEVTFERYAGPYVPPEDVRHDASFPPLKELDAYKLLAASPLVSTVRPLSVGTASSKGSIPLGTF